MAPQYFQFHCVLIRDFPDHATFREKGAKLACVDKLGVFLSLTLSNKANFNPNNKSDMMALKKCKTGKKCMDYLLSPDINHLISILKVLLISILKVLLKIKSMPLFLANGRAC